MAPQAILSEFAEDRRGWHVYLEKQDCWVAFRDAQINGKDLRFLITPNWRDQASTQNWLADVINKSNGNTRLASVRGDVEEVLELIEQCEVALKTGNELASCRTYEQAWSILERLNRDALYFLASIFDVSTAFATSAVVRHRLSDVCASASARKAGL